MRDTNYPIEIVRNVVADQLDATCPDEVIHGIATKVVEALDNKDLLVWDCERDDDEPELLDGPDHSNHLADMDDDSGDENEWFNEEEI